MFASLAVTGSNGVQYADPVIPKDIFMCVGAGNDGESSHNGWMHAENIYGVGAVDIVWSATRNGEPIPGAELLVQAASYTSESEHVDFGSATGLYVNGMIDRFTGTSCAAPTLAGMAALVNDFFIDKTGRPLPHRSMYRFFKDYTVDIESPGKDNLTGWGIPILPYPDEIDIWLYQVPEEEKVVPEEEPEIIPEEPKVEEEIIPEEPKVEEEPAVPAPMPEDSRPEEEGDTPAAPSVNDGTLTIVSCSYEQFCEYMERYNKENSLTLWDIIAEFSRKLKTWFNAKN